MSNVSEEVDSFINGLSSDDEPAKPRRRRLATKSLPAPREEEQPVERDEPREDPRDDRDGDDDGDPPEDMLPRELPRPAETQRSLGGMLGKYRIGEDPNFRIQLHRLMPKFLPGGIQAHGYLEEYVHPITEEYIASEYGGGTYQVVVMGPDPKNPPNGVRRYDSIKVEMAGAPNPERLARSVQAKLAAASSPATVGPPQQPFVMQQENPQLATAALKMAESMAEHERDERRRAEDRATTTAEAARTMFEPVVEAERRRADDVLRAERERAASERAYLEERLKESRDEYRRLEAKVEAMSSAPQVSVSEEIGKLMPLLKGDGESAAAAQKAAESITRSILDRHQIETESLHKQHQTMLESLRSSHMHEIQSMREANRREIEAEREAGRLREQRHEETLKSEREERRRDAELYKKTEDSRDQQWRDRMEQQELNLKVMWESRVETQKSNYESQLQWMRSEIEQLQARLRSFESQVADRGDIVKQLSGLGDLRAAAKNALGIDDSPPPPISSGGGGIGLSGSDAPNWQDVINTAVENLPALIQVINGGGAPQPPPAPPQQQFAPQQPQPQPGQVIQTPQGPAVVVVDPRTGQLAYTPKDQYDAFQAQQQRTSGRPTGGRPRGILGPAAQPARQAPGGIPVPNMAEGLPKPRAWGEPVQPPMPTDATPQQQARPVAQQQPVQQAPQPAPRRTSKPQQGNMDQTKLLIANEVAKLVHVSVEDGDEPEEFVQKVLTKGYPQIIIQTIAAMSPDEVIASIAHVQPNSAGTTPAGQRYIHDAMRILRASVTS